MAIEGFETKVELLEDANWEDLGACLTSAKIESNLPIGAGLGSSAALSCAMAKCFTQSNCYDIAKRFDDYFHQGSSGIDVFTILNGGLCSFELGIGKGFVKLENCLFDRLAQFTFSIIDTGTPRKVSTIKSELSSKKLQHYSAEIMRVSGSFKEQLSNGVLSLSAIINLFNEANELLVELGVSTPRLNELFNALKQSKLQLGAKITGGGGGGCVLIVHCPSISEAILKGFVPPAGAFYYKIKLKS